MRLGSLVFLFFVLQVDFLFAQGWKVSSGESDFDGRYTSAVCRGSGGSYPYSVPLLVINNYNKNSINFYITDFGYGGCDYNDVKFLFDKTREYSANITVNDEKDILFFTSFTGDAGIVLNELIFNEMLISKRLAIRIQNSCYSRDFIFDLNGAASALDKVVGIQNIKSSLAAIKRLEKWEPKVDSMLTYINYPNNAINELTRDKLERLKFFVRRPYTEFYKVSQTDAQLLVDVSLAFIRNAAYLDVTNSRGELVISADDTVNTGYHIEIRGDSIKVRLTNDQVFKEEYIQNNLAWIGFPGANMLRRLDIWQFQSYSHNITPEVLYRCGLSLDNIGGHKYRLEPSAANSTTGILYYSLPNIQGRFKAREFPLLYETMEARSQKEAELKRKADSLQVWLDTPDPSMGPLPIGDVDVKPKPADCVSKKAEDCLNELVTLRLKEALASELHKYNKPFWVNLKVTYRGEIVVENISGLTKTKFEKVLSSLSNLPTVSRPRKSGKVCDVKLELMVSLL